VKGLPDTSNLSRAPKGSRLYDTAYGNVAPRIGVAFRPWASRNLMIRGGFGLFYDLGYNYIGIGPAFSTTVYPARADPLSFGAARPAYCSP
jgi:hypothetical protein